MKKLIPTFLIAVVLILSSGCSLKSTDEESHPLFQRAVKAQEANENKQAVKYFQRYLAIRPDSAKANLLLASIYDENLNKPLAAVYHYQRFLDISPNSPEAENVKKWIEAARKRFYIESRLKYNDPEDVSYLQNSLYSLKLELEKLKSENQKLKSIQSRLIKYARSMQDKEKDLSTKITKIENQHKETLEKLKATEKKLEKIKAEQSENEKEKTDIVKAENSTENDKNIEQDKKIEEKPNTSIEKDTENTEKTVLENNESSKKEELKTETAGSSEETKEKAKTEETSELIPDATVSAPPFEMVKTIQEVPVEPKQRTYTVQKGDSLSSISRKFYGSSRYYKQIFEANQTILPEPGSLKPGQVLEIPINPKE